MNGSDLRLRLQSGVTSAASALARLNERLGSPDARRVVFPIALSALVVGLWVSVRSLPGGVEIVEWRYLGYGLLVAGPLMIGLNTAETELNARLLDRSFGRAPAMRIAVLSSAANMLPLPGGVIVKTAALADLGVAVSTSSAAVAAVGVISLGLSLVYAGSWLLVLLKPMASAAFLALGLLAVALGVIWLMIIRCPPRIVAALVLVKSAASAVAIYALWLPFAALGTRLSLAEISVLSASSTAGLAASFVPAGLGVAEAAAAALAALIDVTPGLAFLSATLGRAIWIVVLIPPAIAFMTSESGR